MPFASSSFLLLVVRPGAPSSFLAPSSDGLQPRSEGKPSVWPTVAASLSFALSFALPNVLELIEHGLDAAVV